MVLKRMLMLQFFFLDQRYIFGSHPFGLFILWVFTGCTKSTLYGNYLTDNCLLKYLIVMIDRIFLFVNSKGPLKFQSSPCFNLCWIFSLPIIFLIECASTIFVASMDTKQWLTLFLQLQSSDISKDKQADPALADTLKVVSHSCSLLFLSYHI
jgi:hypothetical protein